MHKQLSIGLLAVVFLACSDATPPALSVAVAAISSPAGEGSGEPFLTADDDGVLMSWLERSTDGGHELRFARYDGAGWSEPRLIARSERFFVNWADFPSVTVGPQGSLWAHWLERGAEGGYDYGVRVVRSVDGGDTWSDAWTPHEDDSPTEHGFVSVAPTQGGMGFVWLDGRKYATGPDGSEPTEEMSLRYRAMGLDGVPGAETLIDDRVCDCCQTDAALTAAGPVAVYRDRSHDEIRDIYVTRLVDGAWTEGVPVHSDGWETGACPVNGPAVAARGSDVAVAWFTAAGDVPRVKVAFSSDHGDSFGEPVIVDGGSPAGRVDLLMTAAGSVLVSWLERTGGEAAEVMLSEVYADGYATKSVSLTTSSSARASGFPRMVETASGRILLAWTDAISSSSQVRTSEIEIGK